jgi:hypothetical protein
MLREGSSQFSQQLSTFSYPGPDDSTPHSVTWRSFLLPSKLRSYKMTFFLQVSLPKPCIISLFSHTFHIPLSPYLGTAVAQWLRCCATHRKVTGSIPDGVIGIFHWHKSFRSQYGPGVASASNRNEYQENFPGGKCDRCVRLTTLPPSCAVVKKSGNLNFLEPSGPHQTCTKVVWHCA